MRILGESQTNGKMWIDWIGFNFFFLGGRHFPLSDTPSDELKSLIKENESIDDDKRGRTSE